jgi:hypothetical protein
MTTYLLINFLLIILSYKFLKEMEFYEIIGWFAFMLMFALPMFIVLFTYNYLNK